GSDHNGRRKGTGRCRSRALRVRGSNGHLRDILDDEGKKVEARVSELGGVAEYVHLDVTSDDDWQQAIELAESKYGKVDILVNNAGISMRHEAMDVSNEDWDIVMDVNAKGVFLGTRYVIPAMQRAGGGSIVNISSIAGILGRPLASPAYAASKGAVRVFTKNTAGRFASDGIRANSIHPGPIDTDMIRAATNTVRPETRVGEIPMGRLGQADDIASAAHITRYLSRQTSSLS
ncbi:Cyclopentanol dehydrogenase, partial [Geodia barretti]